MVWPTFGFRTAKEKNMYKVRPNERIDFHFTGAKNKSIVVEPTNHSVIKTNTTNPRQMQKKQPNSMQRNPWINPTIVVFWRR